MIASECNLETVLLSTNHFMTVTFPMCFLYARSLCLQPKESHRKNTPLENPPSPGNKRARYLHQGPHRGLESAQRRVGGNIAIRTSLVFRLSWNHVGVALLVDDPVITVKIGDGNCYP